MNLSKKHFFLIVGVHLTDWEDFKKNFGYNQHRQNLLENLLKGLKVLYQYGCKEVCVGGSFVTNKANPVDVDVCYENSHMNWNGLKKHYTEFFDVNDGAKKQKALYKSEFYPYNSYEDYFYTFFQTDKDGNRRGMVKLYLKEVFKDDKKRKAI
jgi:hypothetical protein